MFSKRYFAEASLIAFSVLFALFLNKWFDSYQKDQQRNVALESIKNELYRNSAILKIWEKKHFLIRKKITSIVTGKNDSLKNELLKSNYLNFGLLSDNQSLIDAFLTNTAWESAKSSGIISEFNFEEIKLLTNVYNMQDILMNRTVSKILDYYFETSAHNLNNLDETMLQFHLRFVELTGQETTLIDLYKSAITELNK